MLKTKKKISNAFENTHLKFDRCTSDVSAVRPACGDNGCDVAIGIKLERVIEEIRRA